MVLYIYLIVHDITIQCIGGVGCISISNSQMTFLLASGTLEAIFEVPLVIRIFKEKFNKKD